MHLNPRVKDVVHARLGARENIRLIPPQPYAQFVALAAASRLILTDSGGVQEEAPTLGKPVLVMRDTTERPEGVAAGAVKLVGPRADRIVAETLRLLDRRTPPTSGWPQVANPYGDGAAAPRIAERVREFFQCAATLATPAVDAPRGSQAQAATSNARRGRLGDRLRRGLPAAQVSLPGQEVAAIDVAIAVPVSLARQARRWPIQSSAARWPAPRN